MISPEIGNYAVLAMLRDLQESIEFAVRSELIAPSNEVHELLAHGMIDIDAAYPGELSVQTKAQQHQLLANLTGVAWQSS